MTPTDAPSPEHRDPPTVAELDNAIARHRDALERTDRQAKALAEHLDTAILRRAFSDAEAFKKQLALLVSERPMLERQLARLEAARAKRDG